MRPATRPALYFTCPLCGTKVNTTFARTHRKREHSDVTEDAYAGAVESALASGSDRLTANHPKFPGRSATESVQRVAGERASAPVLQGGSPGLKKRRT